MMGFSGRTRRVTFAVIGGVCYLSGILMLGAKPWIEGLKTLDADTAVIAGNLLALAAVAWTLLAAAAWLVFSVRRLRDAGRSPFFVVVSVVMGFVNDPRTLVSLEAWSERPLASILSLMSLAWLIVLISLPTREAVIGTVTTPGRKTPEPVGSRKSFGLR